MKRDVIIYLKDILAYMDRAILYLDEYELNDFISDNKTCDAVLRCIEVIGEATKKIPDELRANYPDIPWRDMAGMRDKVIHSYFTIDYMMVWLTITEDIPRMVPQIKKVVDDLEKERQ
jgi:uncharacterized protein with HEPN domain